MNNSNGNFHQDHEKGISTEFNTKHIALGHFIWASKKAIILELSWGVVRPIFDPFDLD